MQEKLIFDGQYSVTDEGEVYSLIRGKRLLKGACLGRKKQFRIVSIFDKGVTNTYYVSRLVADAFVPNPNGCKKLRHVDGNPKNDRADNLEWCTQKEITNQSYATDKRKSENCSSCGKKIFSIKHHLCTKCHNKQINAMESARLASKRANEAEKALEMFPDIKPKYTELLELKARGLNYPEIAKIKNCSYQNIQQKIAHYISAVKGGCQDGPSR